RFHDGDEMVEVELPLSVTQLQNVVNVPNFHLLRQHAARYSRLKYGDDWRSRVTRGAAPVWSASQYGLDAMRGIMEVWRPAVLLRPAWTLRVVGDEQMRMLAKFGALSVMLGSRDAVNNYAAALKTNPIVRRVLRTESTARMTRRGSFVSAAAGGLVGGPVGAVAGGALGNRLVRAMARMEDAGYQNVRFGGHSLSGPFGDKGSSAEFYRVHNSARASVDELFGRHEARFVGALKRDASRFRTYTWGESAQSDAVYRAEWANNLRHQIAQDEMGRQFLAGKGVDQVLDWLDNTLEGRRYATLVPWRSDHRAWVEAYGDQVNSYTGGVDEVKSAVLGLADDASDAEVQAILDLIPESRRAPIHGAETEQLMGRSKINQLVNGAIDNSFEILGTMATDELSRNPTFARFYNAEARRLFAPLPPGQVSEALLRNLEDQSRAFALRETRQLLYDLAEQSRFADMTRLVMPFYNAWQEVLTRWTGLAVENPAFVARARQVWEAPDRLGWTYTDDRGSTFLRVRIPEFARGLVNQGVFRGALDSQGYIFLDKRGFNLVANGTPGFGPFVQIGVSEMVKANPSLEDSVRFIIPFGPTDGFVDALLPPTVRRAFDASSGNEGSARANAEARILVTRLTQMGTGEIPTVDFSDPAARADFLESVSDEADQFMRLRLFAGYVAPVAPVYETPYKPYIDIYRSLRSGDYERAREVGAEFAIEAAEDLPRVADTGDRSINADDIFLEAFGEEYFALTQAFTESINGVPPTVEGLEASEQYGDIITAYPEWGGVVAGYDGDATAQFSRAVYDRQMERGERRRLEPDEVLDGPQIRLGWSRYSKLADLLEVARVSRGLPNMQVAGAEDLQQIKRVMIASLAAQHPAWYQEFSVTDRNAWARRIEGARAVVANEALSGRPDIQGLADYLRLRDTVTAWLATRESSSIDATSNRDIAMVWQTLLASLIERNPSFAEVAYRKGLENDPLDAGPLDLATAA
ncbi:MAG: hypothetical protein ACRD2C_10195, partial [Acidimicrobiales bacterium]